MRTIKNYSLTREVFPGDYGPSQVLHYRDKTGKYSVRIGAGTSDSITVLRTEHLTLVYSENTGLGYCGMEAFYEGNMFADRFLEGSEADKILGRGWERKSAIRNAKILLDLAF